MAGGSSSGYLWLSRGEFAGLLGAGVERGKEGFIGREGLSERVHEITIHPTRAT